MLQQRVTQLEGAADALRGEMSAFRAEVRTEFAAVHAEFAAVRAEMREMQEELGASIIATNEETRRHMRVLHEDLVARLATIGEGRPTPEGRTPAPSARSGRRGSRR
jgi:hypothetical protein